jgi:uncharacterized CHY-type Zn-finger protein
MNSLREDFLNLDPYAQCFQSNEIAIAMMVKHGLINHSILCGKCGSIMRIKDSDEFADKNCYRCVNKICRGKVSLKRGSFLNHLT